MQMWLLLIGQTEPNMSLQLVEMMKMNTRRSVESDFDKANILRGTINER